MSDFTVRNFPPGSMSELVDDWKSTRVALGLPEKPRGPADEHQWCEHVSLMLAIMGCRTGTKFEQTLVEEWGADAALARATRKEIKEKSKERKVRVAEKRARDQAILRANQSAE